MQLDRIPKELRAYRQWVCWRSEWREGGAKPTKVPYSPASRTLASVIDPQSWASYDEAVEAYQRHAYNGIGFVLTKNDPYCFVDFDDTQGDVELLNWHKSVHETLATYSEWSPSRTGIHAIVRADTAPGCRRAKVEVYSDVRFMTMTGNVYNDAPIADRTAMIAELIDQLRGSTVAPDNGFDGAERELDASVIDRMFVAKNGTKARDLYEGRWQAHYASQSEADFALQNIIAFYTDNRAQVARIFESAPLYRPKKYDRRPELLASEIAKAFDRKLPTVDVSEGFANAWADIETKRTANLPAANPEPRYTLLSGDDLEALAVTEWRIKGVLPARGIVAIYGPSGSGKSFTAIDMAFAIVEGRDWPNGRFRVTKAFVVYLALEGQAGFRNRVTAWRQDHGHMPTDIRFVFDAFRLHDPAYVAELVEACKPFGQDIVIFIDTMNRATAGMNENSPDDMGRIVEGAAALQRETGGLVVIVAHPGKDAEKQLRGHSSLYAALDTVILVDRQGERRSWKLEKSRDGEDGIEQRFALETLAIGTDADGDTITSCVVRPDNTPREKPLTRNQNLGMASWTSAASEAGRLNETGEFVGVHIEDWRKAFYAISTADNPEAKKKAFRTLRDDLVSAGKLTVKNDVYSVAGPIAAATNEAIAATIKARGIGG